jgi:spore maturation protein CgeB
VDKGITIAPGTLRRAKEQNAGLFAVSYSPDDMFARDLQSVRYLACMNLYDVHVTTKSFNVDELPRLGARDVIFVDNAYEPAVHRPLRLAPDDALRFDARVGFVGTYEVQRAQTMLALARDDVPIKIWGYGWERMRESHPNLEIRPGQLGEVEYTKAINATAINLGFLRKAYRDVQTTRSIEIPACGAFMLAERSEEHCRLFVEGKEAEFFGTYDELLEKIRYYVEHSDERARVAAGGRQRCLTSGYDNAARLAGVLDEIQRRSPAAFGSKR